MAKNKRAASSKSVLAERRSPCPGAGTLDVLGGRWGLLVVCDLFFGGTRVKGFEASPEGIPTNILSERLERLQAVGIIEQVPVDEGAKRFGYRLTTKGKALGPVLVAIRDWGLKWEKETRVGV